MPGFTDVRTSSTRIRTLFDQARSADSGGARHRPGRNFVALDARTGELLWHVNLGGPNASGPIGYTVDGKQYVVGTGQGSTFVFALPE